MLSGGLRRSVLRIASVVARLREFDSLHWCGRTASRAVEGKSMKLISITIAIAVSSILGFSQTDETKSTQKELEKLLFSKTPHVKRARFSGCKLELNATIPPDGKFDPVSGRMPSITPTEAFSTSSIDPAAEKGVVVFEIDLARIALSSVVTKTTNDDKLMNLMLEAKTDGGVMQRTSKRLKNIGGIDILVESKHAAKMAESFRSLIRACEVK